jgi:hypothetical protein
MSVRVRLESHCAFDIGERTPERKALVKQYVKAFMTYAAEHGGQPPGSYRLAGKSPAWAWSDANWEINYTVTQAGGNVTISIYAVRLHSSGSGS